MTENDEVTIVGFDESLAEAFASLNYAWIEENYTVEPHDRDVLDNPLEHIIKPGGEIFFAIIDGAVIGTVALIKSGESTFELAKMAVAPSARGQGVGKLLMHRCIEYAADLGKSEVVLESNTRQAAALRLYKSFGFTEIPLDPNSHFKRVNIRMRLALSPNNL